MKPRVLQLINSLYSAGSERQTVQLAESLSECSRYQVFVASLDPRGTLREELNRIGFVDVPAFNFNSFYGYAAVNQLTRFTRFLREQQIDIVHAHDFYTNVFGMAGAWLAGTPVRIASRRETAGCHTKAQKFVERRSYQLAHAIVANADAVSKHLNEEGVRGNKVVTIYNSLKHERVSPRHGHEEIVKQFNLPPIEHCRYVTIVANLANPVKGHTTFLRAAQRVRRAVPEARFILVGSGRLMDELRALARDLGLGTDVFFIGACDHVADLLFISDVCVLSSLAEGFSNSILEYMGASRPVVATNVGGAREAIIEGETGYLIQPGDEETMATRITDLLLNPDLARSMGRRGRQVVEQKFSPARQLAQTEQLYARLLARATKKITLR